MTPSTPVSNILKEYNACIFRLKDFYHFYPEDEAIRFL
jgi:hypothetical protein